MAKRIGPSVFSFALLLGAVGLACTPNAGAESGAATNEGSTETSAPDGSWAVGSYYRPISNVSPTIEKASFEILEDFTTKLEDEFCGAGVVKYESLRWTAVDSDTVEFSALQDGEPVMWFGGEAFHTIRMRRTDDPDIVIVADGKFEEGPTLGKFKRGIACLKITNPLDGCNGGAYVIPCDNAVTSG